MEIIINEIICDGKIIRVIEEENEKWYWAKDICNVLLLGNNRKFVMNLNNKKFNGFKRMKTQNKVKNNFFITHLIYLYQKSY